MVREVTLSASSIVTSSSTRPFQKAVGTTVSVALWQSGSQTAVTTGLEANKPPSVPSHTMSPAAPKQKVAGGADVKPHNLPPLHVEFGILRCGQTDKDSLSRISLIDGLRLIQLHQGLSNT
eukprot:CAMPEP_0169429218 /NCGR_PEP_ID=MMETSP1042-20121227/1752_1 /TAXON_ID=464988 /ORGANISM="Hemiselmis andersenii, Strain CCMP1180" /LENGTH=120 /DNA_ID=CAMNT_0009539459 /DNA_START=141 /DNA_END=502 /DNA_ORIENTATION=+